MGNFTPKALSLSHGKYQDLNKHRDDALTSDGSIAHFRRLRILLDRWSGSEFRNRPVQGPLSTQIRLVAPRQLIFIGGASRGKWLSALKKLSTLAMAPRTKSARRRTAGASRHRRLARGGRETA
jgi:hypothetical protein